MIFRLRFIVPLILLASVAALPAQKDDEPDRSAPNADGIQEFRPPTDPWLPLRLYRGSALLAREEGGALAKVLPRLFDEETDALVPVNEKTWSSVSAETERLLSALPAAGR